MSKARSDKQTAARIVELLAERHAKDVFFAEAKTGSSWGGCMRLDAWALRRTWSPITTDGYEVKVSRSDWLGDDKWPAYRDYCHRLWIACPAGLIDPSEVPEDVGLLYVAKTGSKLFTKRKAHHRPVEVLPQDLLLYLLMSRVQVVANMHEANRAPGAHDKLAYWRQVLDRRKEGRDLGWAIRGRIREEMTQLRAENSRLGRENEDLARVRELLRAGGIEEPRDWEVRHKLDAVPVSKASVRAMADIARRLLAQAEVLERDAFGADARERAA